MDPDTESAHRRTQAITSLRFLRTDLERQQRERLDPNRLIPAHYVDVYNDAVLAVADELGEPRTRALSIGRDRILLASKREGRPVDAYGRETLLGSVKDLLKRLGAD